MNLNQDKVPTNLEEAVLFLKESLEAEDITYLKEPKFQWGRLHFTIGMLLRNEWSLWEKDTVLVKWFKEHYKLDHADDISSIILQCAIADIRDEPRKDEEMAKQFIEHWKGLTKDKEGV